MKARQLGVDFNAMARAKDRQRAQQAASPQVQVLPVKAAATPAVSAETMAKPVTENVITTTTQPIAMSTIYLRNIDPSSYIMVDRGNSVSPTTIAGLVSLYKGYPVRFSKREADGATVRAGNRHEGTLDNIITNKDVDFYTVEGTRPALYLTTSAGRDTCKSVKIEIFPQGHTFEEKK